jgi:hypothetical protein
MADIDQDRESVLSNGLFTVARDSSVYRVLLWACEDSQDSLSQEASGLGLGRVVAA